MKTKMAWMGGHEWTSMTIWPTLWGLEMHSDVFSALASPEDLQLLIGIVDTSSTSTAQLALGIP